MTVLFASCLILALLCALILFVPVRKAKPKKSKPLQEMQWYYDVVSYSDMGHQQPWKIEEKV